MHFFYMDESGDTGNNLTDPDQPIMVLGGVALRDKSWNTTQEKLRGLFEAFFGGSLPSGFEFHAKDALCPTGEGFFAGHSLSTRTKLAENILALLSDQRHGTFYTALDKKLLNSASLGVAIEYNAKQAYPLAFDANLSAINQHVKKRLGVSARGMLFFDERREHHQDVQSLMRSRRFEVAKAHRIKWVVEFGHPLDSRANPMVQMADLVSFSVRRFLELEHGYKSGWSTQAKKFVASCYKAIDSRLLWKDPVHRKEQTHRKLAPYIDGVSIKPKNDWAARYAV